MSTTGRGPRRQPRSAGRTVAVVVLLVVAGACAPAGLPGGTASSPGATAPSPAMAARAPTAPPAPDSTPAAATPSPPGPDGVLVGPPQAALARTRAAETVAGTEGTFAWDGLVSDAPWIAGSPSSAVRGERLAVVFEPGLLPVEWQATWTPLVAGLPGAPRDGGSGSGEPIGLLAPPVAGPWSLRVTAAFGPDRSASWTWEVAVSP